MNLIQVTIEVSDVEKSIKFYSGLGLILIVKALPHYARFQCSAGNSTFSLHLNNKNLNASMTVYFEVDNVDERVEALSSANYIFEELPTDRNWLWRESLLLDPDNKHIIIYHAGENRLNLPWKISN